MPNKEKAWKCLIKLMNDPDTDVKSGIINNFCSIISYIPYQQRVWKYLIKFTDPYIDDIDNLHDEYLLNEVFNSLGFAFFYMPNKQQAWEDLVKLANEKNKYLREGAAHALGVSYPYTPNKQQAWEDLVILTHDEEEMVRSRAAVSIGFALTHSPDKKQAWEDLRKLTNDRSYKVRNSVAYILSFAFSYIPNKRQVLSDLVKLTSDEDESVRAYANHSLGKICIYKASQAKKEETYKKELEKAISFFEKSLRKPHNGASPSDFCLPFYRSLHTIVFKKENAKEEIDKYLLEAKSVIHDSKSKEMLLEAVSNLANALKETHNLKNMDLETKKCELNFYIKYCDRAAELMINTENTAPYATAAMRKGIPILNRNIKELIKEIQRKAKSACQISKGTPTQGVACAVSKEVQKWEINNQEEMTQKVEDIIYILKTKVADSSENEYVLSKIEAMIHEKNLLKQYETLLFVIGQIPTMKVVPEQELDQKLDQKLQKFDLIFNEITYIKDKLSCISFDISKIKLNSADVISNLKTMKEELEIVCKIEGLNTLSNERLDSLQVEKLDGLNNNILERLDEIKILIFELSKDNGELYQEYSRRLDKLKQSKLDTLLQRYSAAISLISFAISGIQIAR